MKTDGQNPQKRAIKTCSLNVCTQFKSFKKKKKKYLDIYNNEHLLTCGVMVILVLVRSSHHLRLYNSDSIMIENIKKSYWGGLCEVVPHLIFFYTFYS